MYLQGKGGVPGSAWFHLSGTGVYMVDLSRLQVLLNEERHLLEEMLDAEEKTMPVIVEGDARALQEINLYKEELVVKMKRLEEQRRLLCPGELTLKELCRREGLPETNEFSALHAQMRQLHISLQRRIELNRKLLKHNRQFVGYALRLFFPQNEEPLYASSGKVKDKASFPAGLVDSNA